MVPIPRATMFSAMKEPNELLLGQNVGWFVKTKRTSRLAIAEAVDMTVQGVGALIRGKSKHMRPVNLVKLALHLGVTAEDLVTRDFTKPNTAESLSVSEPAALYAAKLRDLQKKVQQIEACKPAVETSDLAFLEKAIALVMGKSRN